MPLCELCTREVPKLTRHHLIPRTRHHNKKNKQLFSREEAHHRIAMICRPCHNQIHCIFTNKELERSHNTIEDLQKSPQLQTFLAWVRKQDPAAKIRSDKRKGGDLWKDSRTRGRR